MDQKVKVSEPAPAGKGGRRHEVIFSAVAIAIGIAVSLVAVEVASRTLLDDGMNFDLEMWKYARDIKRTSPNERIGHIHAPNTSGFYMGVPVSINSLGLRDREYALEKPADTVRILMLGDSLTFGWGVRAEDTVAKKLEDRLNAGGGRAVEVINTGAGNYNTVMEVERFLESGQKLGADIVVLNYFINDAEPVPSRRESYILERSYAAVFLAGRLDILQRTYFGKADWKEYYRNLYSDTSQGWTDAKDAVRRLHEYCRLNGIRLVIVNYPEMHELTPYPFQDVTEKLAALAGSMSVPFIDLLPSIAAFKPETLWVSPMDAHPNNRATEAFTATLEAALRNTLAATPVRGAPPLHKGPPS